MSIIAASRFLICWSLASLSSPVSDASRSLICWSLASLSSPVSDASRSLICWSLASLYSPVSAVSLSWLVARIRCNSLSLLSELCRVHLALSRSRRCHSLCALCSAVSAAWRTLSRFLLRHSLSSLSRNNSEHLVASMLVASMLVTSMLVASWIAKRPRIRRTRQRRAWHPLHIE